MSQKELSTKELRNLELKILLEIHDICTKNNFKYSLTGGSLLGAVRHGGFIPWDDDIDIALPRDDYEKFINYCSENDTTIKLVTHKTNSNYHYLFAKAYDCNTIIYDDVIDYNGIELGVHVDIFPIDGLGDTIKDAITIFRNTDFYRYILIASHWKKYSVSKTHSFLLEPVRLICFIISRLYRLDGLIGKVEKEMKKNSFETSQFVGCICGSYRLKEIMEKFVASEYIDILFEGYQFKAFKFFDIYLKNIYGDYMVLPKSDKRVTHHTFKAYFK